MLQSFRTMLGRLQEMWQKIKSQPLWLGVFALTIAGVFFLVEPTLAQEGVATGVGDWLIRQVAKIMLVIASLAIGLSIFFLRFFIMIASYNNYIDVSVVQLGWVMVRDVANMFFVVALLLIAFGTILGLEEYEWKKNLAKLVLSAILINFSNLIAQLCIDIAHIFTITFLNAISATAGGNLINMFKLDQVLQLTAAQDPSGLDIEVLAAVLPAMLFAIMAAAAIGSYVVVMAGRVVALWALIVISPLAFILGVIPQTKSYAEKWWSEFTKYVIVAPIMVFFLWLSFATIGLGSIATEIEADLPATVRTAGAEAQFGVQRLSMSKVTSWENMANFLIAFAFLMYGIKATQETGVVGSGMIGSAVDFGKKVATIASGYAAGRWLVDKGKSGVVEGAKWTGDALVGDYVERIGNKLKKIPEGYRNWRSAGPQIERDEQTLTEEKLIDPNYQLTEADKKAGFTLENRADGVYKVQGLSEVEMAKGYEIVESKDEKTGKVTRSKVYDGYKKNIKTDAQGNVVYKKDDKGNYVTDNQGRRVAVGADKPLYESKLQELVNRRYQSLLSSRKRLEKVQNDTKLNEEMMDKSIEAQPTHWLGSKNPAQAKDFDRIKRGMLAAMEARSSAKTQEFSTLGEKIVKGSKRFKDGKFQTERGTIAEQIAEHEAKSSQRQSELDLIAKAARTQVLGSDVGKKAFEGKIKADLRVKEEGANISNLEAGMTTGVTLATVAATEAANEVVRKYKTDFEQAQNAGDFAEQDKILRKMMADGLIGKAEFDELNRNQEINRQMNSYSNLPDKDAALNQLVADGTISAKEKEKYSKLMGNSRQLSGVFPSEKSNILQRTITAEKEAHLQAERLSTVQKEEEGKFAEDEHGMQEAREIALLKERAAAAQAKIDRSDETGKADVATAALPGDTPELVAQKAAFAKIRAERIAAQKAAHTEGQKVSTEEKEAEKVYTESAHGTDELKTEEELKERAAAAEAKIKELTAQAKKDVQEKPEFAEKQKERIAAEQKAASLETQAQKFEKERVADYVGGIEGQAAKLAETRAKEQIAAAEARTKQAEATAKADLSETEDPEFLAAQAAKIEAERVAKKLGNVSAAQEKEAEQAFENSPTGKKLSEEEFILKTKLDTAENIIKQLQAEAKLKVIGGNADFVDSSEAKEIYDNFLKSQSVTKIVSETVSTDEKTMGDNVLREIMAEGLDVDKKITDLEQDKLKLNSKNNDSLIPEIDELKNNLKKIIFDRKKLEKKFAEEKDEAKQKQIADEITKFNTNNEKVEEKYKNKIQEIGALIQKNNESDPQVLADKQAIENKIAEQKKRSSSWQYAASKARSEESGRALSVKQNTLLSDVEQREIYNKRGIQTPTNAISELVEKYEKEFNQMSYEMVVNNMRDNLKEMLRRQDKMETTPPDQLKEEDKITESDKASLAGLFKHAFNNGWVDDAIPSIMNDPELAAMAKKIFGWDDQVFTIEKINQVQSLFATGMNKNFAKVHSQVGKMMDLAEDEFGMDMLEFFKKWENNQFSDDELKFFIENKINLTEVMGDAAGKDAVAAKEIAKEYIKTQEENQAQLQLLGNLRDQAIAGNHPENAGHSQYVEIAPGKGMYIMKGSKSARNYVYNDVNKMNVTKRAAMHTHAVADIDESDGIATRYRREDLRIVRAGINNANDRRPTNVRYSNQAAGLTATEDFTQYLAGDNEEGSAVDENGEVRVGQTEKASGAFLVTGVTKNGIASKRHLNRSAAFKDEYKGMSIEQQRCATVADLIHNVFAPQIATVPKDFLMGMAEKSGVDPNDAVSDGKMNLMVSIWDAAAKKEVKVHISNINQLIGLYNNGKFGPVDNKNILNRYSQVTADGRGGRQNRNNDQADDGGVT